MNDIQIKRELNHLIKQGQELMKQFGYLQTEINKRTLSNPVEKEMNFIEDQIKNNPPTEEEINGRKRSNRS